MKIAVFLPNWVGDLVMATPALRALRRHFPEATMIGIVRPHLAALLEGTAWLDRQIHLDPRGPWSRRWPSVAARLRREQVDLAVLFSNSFHTAWVAWLGGCRRRVGYNRYGRSLLLSDPLPPRRNQHGRLFPSPVIDAYNQLAEYVGCPWPTYRLELATTDSDEQAAMAVWEAARWRPDQEVICFHPGAAFGSAKHWRTSSFAQLAQTLVDRRSSGILVLCGPGEQALAQDIVAQVRRPGVYSLAEHELSLGLSKACVRRADLLVATDSGPRHFAAAFGRPVVTLFGPTHIAWTETYYAKAIHLQKQVDCGPCQRRVCPLDHRCMHLLTPDDAFQAAQDLLNRFAKANQPAA
jgi:heptosyltransferase-2